MLLKGWKSERRIPALLFHCQKYRSSPTVLRLWPLSYNLLLAFRTTTHATCSYFICAWQQMATQKFYHSLDSLLVCCFFFLRTTVVRHGRWEDEIRAGKTFLFFRLFCLYQRLHVEKKNGLWWIEGNQFVETQRNMWRCVLCVRKYVRMHCISKSVKPPVRHCYGVFTVAEAQTCTVVVK